MIGPRVTSASRGKIHTAHMVSRKATEFPFRAFVTVVWDDFADRSWSAWGETLEGAQAAAMDKMRHDYRRVDVALPTETVEHGKRSRIDCENNWYWRK